MVVKVYISGISGNKEVKKHQQRVQMILESKNIDYVCIDITEPGKEDEKEFMQQKGKARNSKYPLPPQLFNEDVFCGDYEDFDLANEIDDLEKFLKLAPSISKAEVTLEKETEKSATQADGPVENGEVNGTTSSRENSLPKEEEQQELSKTAGGGGGGEEEEEEEEE